MKIIAMIPARLGSTRVKKKNLRLLGGKTLVDHVIESSKKSKLIDEIYINSESGVFKEIANNHQVSFYKRNEELSSNTATNDDFSLDFIENIDCNILLQILPTSPFITVDEIDGFINKMLENNFQTMVSTKHVQIETIFNGNPVNFDQKAQTPPSQELKPLEAYACSLMAWECNKFRENMDEYGSAYHGGSGSIGFYELKGYSTVDIDNEEDFLIAEAIINASVETKKDPTYYGETISELKETQVSHTEVDVESILKKDGVESNDLYDTNKELVSAFNIIENLPKDSSWSKRIIDSESNSMTIIGQMPGEGNRRHFHPDWNEWWYIYQGEWDWEIDGEVKTVKKGDIVFMRKNRVHKITAAGEEMAIRFAVSRSDVIHTYVDDDNK